ncbi:uncharacterized protein BX663DRAFT_497709 [Cokeromyces recurvatus]|uniref:uncharacterized protein n=1 Tax=Cokeromyces recurvatus TaxID=90255 RepID=UPI002220D41A|nr:uncharacterized protein BX663DRAFT_497709 [Cokeromyces recurvatus]KAI7906823.1 hypothetical protein BX663DRAFT_497709 [Cokeromyces recurvatus]
MMNNNSSLSTKDFASDPKMHFNEQTGKWSYVGEDNVSYEYDEKLGAWFPMFDEKLMQEQASVYAIEGVEEEVVKPKEKRKRSTLDDESTKKIKRESKPNTSVYVTGIPPDTSVEEIKTTFTKCGVIMEDLDTGEPKIKLYRDGNGNLKGDALITYFKEESVSLAINLLDDSELRPGQKSTKINVQKAVFKEKEQPTQKKSTVGKLKAKKKIQQLNRKFDWIDDEVGKKQEKFAKIVILKNMYTQEELDSDPTLLLELKEDVREECEKLGEVTNVILYDKSPGGVISVRYKEKESADACVALMNGRYFSGRQISAEIYDGKTRYEKSGGKSSEEDEEAEKLRLERYAKWLEEGGGDKTP